MTATQPTVWLTAILLTASLLGACSGSEDEPVGEPASEATATAAPVPDADGFTPEQGEVIEAAEAYSAAIVGRGTAPIGPAVRDLVTKDVYDSIVSVETQNIEEAGLQYIGQTILTPAIVTVSGDTATVQGCKDGSAAFIVKRGETTAGVGSRPVASATIDFDLVSEDGKWLISDTESSVVSKC